MIKNRNNTTSKVKSSFDVINSETGEYVGDLELNPVTKQYLTRPGYRRVYMQTDGVYETFLKSLSSGTENAIAIDIMKDVGLDGILKNDQQYYADKNSVSVRTVGSVFKKAKESGMIKSAGRDVYVNSLVVLPYNSKDSNNHFLQRRWVELWNLNPGRPITKQQADELTIRLRTELAQ